MAFTVAPAEIITKLQSFAHSEIVKPSRLNEDYIKNRIDKKYVFESQKGKKLLINFLKSKKLEFIDTHANFIHINFREKKNKLQRSFKQNNILVKGGLAIKNFENFTRITTGPEDQINKLIRIIKKFF